MSLNRSSYWTKLTGEKVRVKHMTLTEISCALLQLEDTELQNLGDDPYLVQQLCSVHNLCNILPTPDGKKDGFLIEDWCDMLNDELRKRLNLICKPIAKQGFLAKLLNFW